MKSFQFAKCALITRYQPLPVILRYQQGLQHFSLFVNYLVLKNNPSEIIGNIHDKRL